MKELQYLFNNKILFSLIIIPIYIEPYILGEIWNINETSLFGSIIQQNLSTANPPVDKFKTKSIFSLKNVNLGLKYQKLTVFLILSPEQALALRAQV